MSRTQLHLVDGRGNPVPVSIKVAVEAAFSWAVRAFPHIDPALLAGWAEAVGNSMKSRDEVINSPRRYAFAALHGKVREWYRSSASKEISVGIGPELEQWIGMNRTAQIVMDQKILFEQLSTKLNERDRYILVLLLQDITNPTGVAAALNISYEAAAKAIQRVKGRIAAALVGRPLEDEGLGQASNNSGQPRDEAIV